MSNEQLAKSTAEQPVSAVLPDHPATGAEDFHEEPDHTAFGDFVEDIEERR